MKTTGKRRLNWPQNEKARLEKITAAGKINGKDRQRKGVKREQIMANQRRPRDRKAPDELMENIKIQVYGGA